MISILDETNAVPLFPLVKGINQIFKEQGFLKQALGLDYREQQHAMALSVAESMITDTPLLFEAGTGVGKSLAYLIPGLIMGIESKRPFIVSSHTIALQEQILQNDLPMCRSLFEGIETLNKYIAFKTALLIGKGNYLCNYRLDKAFSSQAELFPTEEQKELERIADWAERSKDGIRQELNPMPRPEVWEWVTADNAACKKGNCNPQTCFYRKARAKIESANLIIINHSLLFSFINAGAIPGSNIPGILFPHDFLVLDEAHTVPSIATKHLGMRVSSYALEFALKMLYNPLKRKGLFSKRSMSSDRELVVDALNGCSEFFSHLRGEFLNVKDVFRVTQKGFVDTSVIVPLRRLTDRLTMLCQQEQNTKRQEDLEGFSDRIKSYANSITLFIEQSEEDHVYWLESSGKTKQIVNLQTAPIDVAPYIRKYIFNAQTSSVFTSATLSINENPQNFREKCGAENEMFLLENSPFDYENHTNIYVVEDAPSFEYDKQSKLHEYFADYIQFCASMSEGGLLVLFTSYAEMKKTALLNRTSVRIEGRKILVQGEGIPRSEMLKMFKDDGNAVLFGTDSFGTGVDIPGKALSQVILTRLPFENPSHPISQARSEWVSERGGSPFVDIMLPDAIIKFRQGVGRLIRKTNDKGAITVLDSRILKKEYGRQFLGALPKTLFTKMSKATRTKLFTIPK